MKPTAVSYRPGISGLRNKAICDEILNFGYPSVRLKSAAEEVWYGGKMEVHIHGTARNHQAAPAVCLQGPGSTTSTLKRDNIGPLPRAISGCAGRAILAEPPARRVKFTRKASRLPCGDRLRPFDHGWAPLGRGLIVWFAQRPGQTVHKPDSSKSRRERARKVRKSRK